MSDFKNQKEIYEYLLSGGIIQDKSGATTVRLCPDTGIVQTKNSHGHWYDEHWNFSTPIAWLKYTEEKPKKRYWIWDIKNPLGSIYKIDNYLDDSGIGTNGVSWFRPEELYRKHENEFIEI